MLHFASIQAKHSAMSKTKEDAKKRSIVLLYASSTHLFIAFQNVHYN